MTDSVIVGKRKGLLALLHHAASGASVTGCFGVLTAVRQPEHQGGKIVAGQGAK